MDFTPDYSGKILFIQTGNREDIVGEVFMRLTGIIDYTMDNCDLLQSMKG